MTLQATAVSVRLGGRAVLDDVTLALQPGEVTAVLGPNGAGKSTLLTCLAGLRRPDAGEVLLAGQPIAAIAAAARARRMSVLPQSQEIAWPVDVETLVSLGRIPHRGGLGGGLGEDDHRIVAAALDEVGMTPFAKRIATTLSGGERGRVLLARALAGEPEWLLADEPLTGLDPAHQFDACDLFRRTARGGVGVVLTLHDLALASRVADRIIVLSMGRVAADGAPGEVLTAELLADVYGVVARVTSLQQGLSIELLGRKSR